MPTRKSAGLPQEMDSLTTKYRILGHYDGRGGSPNTMLFMSRQINLTKFSSLRSVEILKISRLAPIVGYL